MTIFLVVGLFGCRNYAIAEFYASKLAEQIPGIEIKCQAYSESEFKDILREMCPILHSNHSGSPLIWKDDINQIGSCPMYIGGVNKFLDFCKENYGNALIVSPEQVLALIDKATSTNAGATSSKIEKIRRITIYGARNTASSLLIMELLHCDSLYERDGLEIRIYDPRPETVEYLEALVWDMECIDCSYLYKRKIIHAKNAENALNNTELVIMMLEAKRKRNEGTYAWLMRNTQLMKKAAINFDAFCPTSPRVVVTCVKPLCFNAHALLKHSKVSKEEKLIASTNYLGLEILPYLSMATRIPTKEIFAPPVWGYIGLNQLVDTCHTKCNYRLWEITTRLHKNKKQEFDTPPPIINEERDLCFRSHSLEYIWRWVGKYKESVRTFYGCDPYMSQVNSVIEIIKLWFDGDKRPKSEVISAGVLSTGFYGIPKGIFFSQPVFLEGGNWKPYENLEMPHFQIKLRYLTTLPMIISNRFELSPILDDAIEKTFYPETEKPQVRKMTLVQQKEELMKFMRKTESSFKTDDEDQYLSEIEMEKRNLMKIKIKKDLKKLRQEMKDMEMMRPSSWYKAALEKRQAKLPKIISVDKGVENVDSLGISKKKASDVIHDGVVPLTEIESTRESISDSNFSNKENQERSIDDLICNLIENFTVENLEKIPDIDLYKEIFADYYYRKMLTLHDEDNG